MKILKRMIWKKIKYVFVWFVHILCEKFTWLICLIFIIRLIITWRFIQNKFKKFSLIISEFEITCVLSWIRCEIFVYIFIRVFTDALALDQLSLYILFIIQICQKIIQLNICFRHWNIFLKFHVDIIINQKNLINFWSKICRFDCL